MHVVISNVIADDRTKTIRQLCEMIDQFILTGLIPKHLYVPPGRVYEFQELLGAHMASEKGGIFSDYTIDVLPYPTDQVLMVSEYRKVM